LLCEVFNVVFGGGRVGVAGFIVDFYCHKVALVVEVDGDIHDLQQEEDARREKVLREMGLRTCAATERSVEALSALGEQILGKIEKISA